MWGITSITWDFGIYFFIVIHLLISCSNVEQNPGPKDTVWFSLYHQNLITLTVHDFAKISTLIAFNSYQDFTISSDDSSLSLDGYKLIRSDRSGFCICYRETLRVKTIQINYPSLDTKPSLWN